MSSSYIEVGVWFGPNTDEPEIAIALHDREQGRVDGMCVSLDKALELSRQLVEAVEYARTHMSQRTTQ